MDGKHLATDHDQQMLENREIFPNGRTIWRAECQSVLCTAL